MRLTNFIRETFVRAVMADVPKKDFDEEIIKLAKEAIHYTMPKEIIALLNDEKLSRWLNQTYVHVPDGCSSFHYYKPDNWKISEHAPMYWERIINLGKEKKAQTDMRRELQKKLETCAAACTTRKQLVDMMPEFEKYLPPDQAKIAREYPLVANVVADFVKAGWPKGTQK